MHYGTIKISSEYEFNHRERIALIFIWPITLIFFIYSFIKTFFFGK
jgi:hypothetical protein